MLHTLSAGNEAVTIVDFINALVDCIVFKTTAIEAERILGVGVDLLYSACFLCCWILQISCLCIFTYVYE